MLARMLTGLPALWLACRHVFMLPCLQYALAASLLS
jgi:hypothetical protein